MTDQKLHRIDCDMGEDCTCGQDEITLTLTADEVDTVLSGLDAHEYWDLASQEYRASGSVLEEAEDDDEYGDDIKRVRALYDKIAATRSNAL